MNAMSKVLRFLLWFALLMALAAETNAGETGSEPVTICLTSEAELTGPKVLLGDIATFSGGSAEMQERLGRMAVSRPPRAGKTLRLFPVQIAKRLRQAGLESDHWRFADDAPVNVIRGSQRISAERLCATVREFILANAPWQPGQLHIRPMRYRHDVIIPKGAVSLSVITPKHTDWLGSMRFGVRVDVNGHTVKRLSIPVALEVRGPVVLAAKPLGRNQPIAPDDIRIVEMNLARAPRNAISDPRMVIGRTADRSIAASAILRSDQFDAPPTVQKGDMVRIVAESAELKVTTRGLAKEDGGQGERIQVMNLNSQKTVYARIMDAQTVRVEF